MSNNKQSSIEYLATQILDNWNDIQAGARNIDEFIEQAKAMHKQEIENAWNSFDGKTFEQYYNETYGNNTP
jgi:hypothetical protein